MRRPPPIQDWLKYPVTSGVATLALLVTLAKLAGKDVSFLYMYSDSWHIQFWGLLTCIFPHGDPIHLIFNLYWLWVFGTLVEAVYGSFRTAGVIIFFALGSSAAEFAIFEGGIGLSGVGYGLFALLWVLSRSDERFRGAVDSQTINLFVIWFFLCIYLTYTGVWRIGNVAHGMGAVLGAILGFCIVAEGMKRRFLEGALGLLLITNLVLASMARDYVNRSPDKWKEFAVRGHENLQDHDYQHAVKNLEKAVKLNRQDPDTWNLLGFAYWELGKLEEATEAIAHAYSLRPSSNQYRQILARCKSSLAYQSQMDGKQAEAVSLYEEALALDNENASAWYNLALARFQLGNTVSAKEAADHAASLDRTNSDFQSFKEFLEKALSKPKKGTTN